MKQMQYKNVPVNIDDLPISLRSGRIKVKDIMQSAIGYKKEIKELQKDRTLYEKHILNGNMSKKDIKIAIFMIKERTHMINIYQSFLREQHKDRTNYDEMIPPKEFFQ